MTHWRDLERFYGIDLEDTWILGWQYHPEPRQLVFEVELSLWPGHPAYERPRRDQWTCYKRARLVFTGVSAIQGLEDQASIKATVGPDGSLDYSSFDGLEEDGHDYRLDGEFGNVRLSAESLVIAFVPDASVA